MSVSWVQYADITRTLWRNIEPGRGRPTVILVNWVMDPVRHRDNSTHYDVRYRASLGQYATWGAYIRGFRYESPTRSEW
jgi:hypothetical protein